MKLEDTCKTCGRVTTVTVMYAERVAIDDAENWLKLASERHQYHVHMSPEQREIIDLMARKYGETP